MLRGFGGALQAFLSTVAEFVFSSITASIFLMFQTRSVFQVFMGRDGGWPTNNRGDGRLTLGEAWAASGWISFIGLIGLGLTNWLAPNLLLWLLPVAVPMIMAPLLICWSSFPSRSGLFTVPTERVLPPIMARHEAWLARWEDAPLAPSDTALIGGLHV